MSEMADNGPEFQLSLTVGFDRTRIDVLRRGESIGLSLGGGLHVDGILLDDALMEYIKSAYGLLIDRLTADSAIFELGSAVPLESRRSMQIQGRHVESNELHALTLTDKDVQEALGNLIDLLVEQVGSSIQNLMSNPERYSQYFALPETLADMLIIVKGDYATLKNLDRRLEAVTGLKVIVEAPVEKASATQDTHRKVELSVTIDKRATAITLINREEVIFSRQYPVAGIELIDAVTAYMRAKHNLLIGPRTAEKVSLEIGSALPPEPALTGVIKGRNLINGLPEAVNVTDAEIREAIAEVVDGIVGQVVSDVKLIPAEVQSEILESGIVLRGEFGKLKKLDQRLQEATGMRVTKE